MKLTITSIELKSIFKLLQLYRYSFHVMNQLKASNCASYKTRGVWTKHYTMTLWRNEEDIKTFAHNGAHLQAMKQSRSIAKEIKTITIDANELPNWKDAQILLRSKGKSYIY